MLHTNNGTVFISDKQWLSSETISLFSDASGEHACAAVFGKQWFHVKWPASWATKSIQIKELLPIVLAAEIWGPKLASHNIIFVCDNLAIVHVI